MKIGARVLKTGLAITLSIYLSTLIIPENSAALAAIAAVTTTAPSVKKSFEMFKQRILANIIGGVVAVIMQLSLGSSPVSAGIGSILLITVLNALKLSDVLTLAVITLVAIMSSITDDPIYISAGYRVLETLIGVTVSFLINMIIHPPKYEQRFHQSIMDTCNELIVILRASLRKNIDFTIMGKDIEWANKSMAEIDSLYDLLHDELILSKQRRVERARRLVVLRHFTSTLRSMVALIDVIHKNDHVFKTFPVSFRSVIRKRLDILLDGHEQIILKFHGRVPVEAVQFIEVTPEYRSNYIKEFYKQTLLEIDQDDIYESEVNGVIHIMSAIYRYEEVLRTLNRIITIYRKEHQEPIIYTRED